MGSVPRIVQDWFEVDEVEPGVFLIGEPFHSENVRSYLIIGTDRAILLDTGMGVGDISALVGELTTLPVSVLNSHAHWDHIGGNAHFSRIFIHRAEAADLEAGASNEKLRSWFGPESLRGPLPPGISADTITIQGSRATELLDGGEIIDIGTRKLAIIHAPGHSDGGIVVVDRDNGLMFSTDVVYASSIYAHLPWCDFRRYRETLVTLESESRGLRALYPSHDGYPLDPAIVGDMRRAFDEILAGREPDEVWDDRTVHQFDTFRVFAPLVLPDRDSNS